MRSASSAASVRSSTSSKYLLIDTSSLMPLRRRVLTMNSRARAYADGVKKEVVKGNEVNGALERKAHPL